MEASELLNSIYARRKLKTQNQIQDVSAQNEQKKTKGLKMEHTQRSHLHVGKTQLDPLFLPYIHEKPEMVKSHKKTRDCSNCS